MEIQRRRCFTLLGREYFAPCTLANINSEKHKSARIYRLYIYGAVILFTSSDNLSGMNTLLALQNVEATFGGNQR